MYPPVFQLESRRRELRRELWLAEDLWAAAAAREARERPRSRRRASRSERLRPSVADER
jgi:hypothetical protein